ncbi:MAG TPA: ABC transporter permease [candidate division Zixibacteria bacterium]|jgi:putative ABC transport system permease protein|nr:ABC transporter permease [candidate division Zixibacteria bacterium]HBZ01956.1 ABC transporter permease [candidate division Zixibacteria bacterium]
MNLAIRDILYHKWRFIQTSFGLGLLIAVVMSMGGIYRGLIADATVALNSTGADLWVVQKGTVGPFAEASRLPEDAKYRIAEVPGIAQASGLSFQNIQITRYTKPLRFFLVGYELDGFGGPPIIIAGRNINQSHYEMVVDKSMKMQLGETIRLGLSDYTVVGITKGMVSVSGDPYAYVSLADAQDIQFKDDNNAIRNNRARIADRISKVSILSPAQISQLAPLVTEIAGSTHIVNTVAAKLAPGTDIKEVQETIQRWNHYQAISTSEQEKILTAGMIQKSKMQLSLFRSILLIISAVIITLIIYTMTMEKIRVIATLKLIGSPNKVVAGLVLQQSLLIGTIAYTIGYVIISLTYDKFPRRVELIPFDLAALFVIVMVICVFSSLLGIRKAMRVDSSQALGG